MLLHLAPRFLLSETDSLEPVALEISIAELGFSASTCGDIELARPYPNPNYIVAGKNAMITPSDGILLKTPSFCERFTLLSRWSVRDKQTNAVYQCDHQVTYLTTDQDFDAYTDDPRHWLPTACGNFFDRRDPAVQHAPMVLRPVMETAAAILGRAALGLCQDTIEQGLLIARTETFRMPSVDPARLFSKYGNRTPLQEYTFHLPAGTQQEALL